MQTKLNIFYTNLIQCYNNNILVPMAICFCFIISNDLSESLCVDEAPKDNSTPSASASSNSNSNFFWEHKWSVLCWVLSCSYILYSSYLGSIDQDITNQRFENIGKSLDRLEKSILDNRITNIENRISKLEENLPTSEGTTYFI